MKLLSLQLPAYGNPYYEIIWGVFFHIGPLVEVGHIALDDIKVFRIPVVEDVLQVQGVAFE
jgi:hypothetical protein